MKTLTINKNDSGQRLDKFLTKKFKNLPMSLMNKYIRKKDIKINGKRCEISTRLNMTESAVNLWFGDLTIVSFEDNKVFFSIKSEFKYNTILKQGYDETIASHFSKLLNCETDINELFASVP